MSIQVKICGINDQLSLRAAVDGGASYVGFVFYLPSPRALMPIAAAALAENVPINIKKVGLFVDPTDEQLQQTLKAVNLDIIQLHGAETTERVLQIKTNNGKQVMKAIRIAGASDLASISAYETVADYLLLDSKSEVMPGGSGMAFDWSVLRGQKIGKPWMLAGGLNNENLTAAVAATGACIVDVSSGVENAPGHKNPAKIHALLALARTV